jgi:prophage regulatory protein
MDAIGKIKAPLNDGAPMTLAAPPKPEKYLRLSDVESLTGLKKSSIYAGMKAGTFPPSIRLSARAVAWPESRIATWQAQREQAGGAQ